MAIDSQSWSTHVNDTQAAAIPHQHEVMISDAFSKDTPIAFKGTANSEDRPPTLCTKGKATGIAPATDQSKRAQGLICHLIRGIGSDRVELRPNRDRAQKV